MLQKSWRYYRKNKKSIRKWFFLFVFIWYLFSLPEKPFDENYSTVLISSEHELLGAHIASDGQWRFPPSGSTPYKLRVCITRFEDKQFRTHIGFSTKGIFRALKLNISSGEIKSGGSTITQQVVRLMRRNPPRTYLEKIHELILATRVELHYTKDEILNMYSAHAPFGNNVVGIEAASWRYFGRNPEKLSWAESATLAVLPNAPGLIYPGKNHDRLLAKRNRLLKDLFENEFIDKITYLTAIEETLPDKPLPLPQKAPHLLQRCMKYEIEQRIESTLVSEYQDMANEELNNYIANLDEQGIRNGSILISSVETGEVLAYVANIESEDEWYSADVDCIQAARSPGSVLKPLLYMKAMEQGIITPEQLLPDVPSKFGDFNPNNFSRQYQGAISANKALCKSLNIPMVYLLREYGLSKFHNDLKRLGFHKMNKNAQHYGLSLILGGGEASSWEINSCYNALAASTLNKPPVQLHFNQKVGGKKIVPHENTACVYSMFNALTEVSRPDEDNNWKAFESAEKIAWKTGTSFGFRDALAVGITPKFVVSIWVGNANGEGQPGLTGVKVAAPLLFSIFRKLSKSNQWFHPPKSQLVEAELCTLSGNIASRFCEKTKVQWIPRNCLGAAACSFHQIIHTNTDESFRVNSSILSPNEMKHLSWFILPPLMEKYYKASHPEYTSPPPFDPRCVGNLEKQMGFIYPKPNTQIHIPKEINGLRGKTVFEVSHRNSNSMLFWHLDDVFLGTTNEIHQMGILTNKGIHTITVVDEQGRTISEQFEVVSK